MATATPNRRCSLTSKNAPKYATVVLGAINPSALDENLSGNADNASDRIIYEIDTGKLFFDKDGTGGAAKVQFARIDTNFSLFDAFFFVF